MAQRLADQAQQLHQALACLVQKYQCRDRNDICCYGISVSQCHTLEALGEQGTLTMQALAKCLHLAVSTVTRLIDNLAEKGLVERHTSVRDRRVCEVALTSSGCELLHKIQRELIAREQAVLQRIPAAARDHVIWAIEEFSRAVDDWRQTMPHGSPPEGKTTPSQGKERDNGHDNSR